MKFSEMLDDLVSAALVENDLYARDKDSALAGEAHDKARLAVEAQYQRVCDERGSAENVLVVLGASCARLTAERDDWHKVADDRSAEIIRLTAANEVMMRRRKMDEDQLASLTARIAKLEAALEAIECDLLPDPHDERAVDVDWLLARIRRHALAAHDTPEGE